jgi:hypothetical protein
MKAQINFSHAWIIPFKQLKINLALGRQMANFSHAWIIL